MKRIMLVDDKAMSNFIMKKYIEIKAPQHHIHEFTDPQIAFSEIDTIAPDIIFLDLNMPVMNGWQFLENMKKNNKQNKVAILTSSTNEQDEQESTKYQNVINFFVKPFDADELARLLASI
jgi:CheY-like chemotaxis protein